VCRVVVLKKTGSKFCYMQYAPPASWTRTAGLAKNWKIPAADTRLRQNSLLEKRLLWDSSERSKDYVEMC
jgi:hypothetical protein